MHPGYSHRQLPAGSAVQQQATPRFHAPTAPPCFPPCLKNTIPAPPRLRSAGPAHRRWAPPLARRRCHTSRRRAAGPGWARCRPWAGCQTRWRGGACGWGHTPPGCATETGCGCGSCRAGRATGSAGCAARRGLQGTLGRRERTGTTPQAYTQQSCVCAFQQCRIQPWHQLSQRASAGVGGCTACTQQLQRTPVAPRLPVISFPLSVPASAGCGQILYPARHARLAAGRSGGLGTARPRPPPPAFKAAWSTCSTRLRFCLAAAVQPQCQPSQHAPPLPPLLPAPRVWHPTCAPPSRPCNGPSSPANRRIRGQRGARAQTSGCRAPCSANHGASHPQAPAALSTHCVHDGGSGLSGPPGLACSGRCPAHQVPLST